MQGESYKCMKNITVSVQLINAISGPLLRENTYESKMKETIDLLTIQSRILHNIATELEEFNNPK